MCGIMICLHSTEILVWSHCVVPILLDAHVSFLGVALSDFADREAFTRLTACCLASTDKACRFLVPCWGKRLFAWLVIVVVCVHKRWHVLLDELSVASSSIASRLRALIRWSFFHNHKVALQTLFLCSCRASLLASEAVITAKLRWLSCPTRCNICKSVVLTTTERLIRCWMTQTLLRSKLNH